MELLEQQHLVCLEEVEMLVILVVVTDDNACTLKDCLQ